MWFGPLVETHLGAGCGISPTGNKNLEKIQIAVFTRNNSTKCAVTVISFLVRIFDICVLFVFRAELS